MSEVKVHELDKQLIQRANNNSFNGTRGNIREHGYYTYAKRILGWPISDAKKQKLLDKLYEKCTRILSLEAQHVSVMVAGPAKYDARKLDKGDQILQASSEFSEWFSEIEKQVEDGTKKQEDNGERLVEMIRFCDERPELDPTGKLAELATVNSAKFIELFEELLPKYRWRKNSSIYKLYNGVKDGTVKEIHAEVFHEDENLTAYRKGDRAYIRFVMRPQRQLAVALKSRGWWWNSREKAWSTYLEKVDEEWVRSISERYENYV